MPTCVYFTLMALSVASIPLLEQQLKRASVVPVRAITASSIIIIALVLLSALASPAKITTWAAAAGTATAIAGLMAVARGEVQRRETKQRLEAFIAARDRGENPDPIAVVKGSGSIAGWVIVTILVALATAGALLWMLLEPPA